MLLAIESSTPTGSVAVGDGSGVLAEFSLGVIGAHSAALLPAVDRVMSASGVAPADLTGVVVGAGPGSFTGVRIAAATAKGVVHARDLPLLAYSSLLAAAVGGWGAGRPVCALFDARRRDVYAGCWRFRHDGWDEVVEPTAMSIDEVMTRFGSERPIILGDAAVRHGDELRAAGFDVLPPMLGAPRAAALLWLAAVDPGAGRVAVPADWEPDYVKEPGIGGR